MSICLYHNDMDGKAAAFVVRLKHAHNGECNFEFVPMDYGKKFDWGTVAPGTPVWIVDFSIEPEEMATLEKLAIPAVWIDHHKTAIEKYADYPNEIEGLRVDGEAGCELTWRYCFPDEPMPRMIELVGDRDVWRWQFKQETANFHAGSAMCDTRPEADFWMRMMHDSHQFIRVLDAGATINGYKAQHNAEVLKRIGFEAQIDGHKCLCMNACAVDSNAFGEGAMDEYPIVSSFYFDGQQYTVSLYSKSVDVSEIAKARGGGGHKGASGFQCDALPYEPMNG